MGGNGKTNIEKGSTCGGQSEGPAFKDSRWTGIRQRHYQLSESKETYCFADVKGYSVRKGPNYAPIRKKPATDLTRENLQRGDWKELEFKEYNFNAKGPPAECGHLHPLNKVKDRLKDIFRQLNFWNFDALFQPQQHSVRDSHDTFFMKVPSTTSQLPEDYVEVVKKVHESGGYGSRGYNYDWKRDEANKNLL